MKKELFWTPGSFICPECHGVMIFRKNYKGQHIQVRCRVVDCPMEGKIFRFQLPKIEVEEE